MDAGRGGGRTGREEPHRIHRRILAGGVHRQQRAVAVAAGLPSASGVQCCSCSRDGLHNLQQHMGVRVEARNGTVV